MIEKITCPNCDHRFDIESVLASDLKKQQAKELAVIKQQMQVEQNQRLRQLEEDRKQFEQKKQRENELFMQKLEKEKKQIAESLKTKIAEDYKTQIELQNKELLESQSKIKALQSKELELMQMQRKMDQMLQQKEIDLQKKMIEERGKIQEELQKQLSQEMELKMLEKDKKLEDQHKLIEELKRKSEQGSMQLQGEIQELAIEEYLKYQFPFDQIEEVKKGQVGADTLQVVINSHQEVCGRIVYESKRTKSFSNEWIKKLKIDQQRIKADIAVIVTETMPKDMKGFGEMDGIWVCSFEDFKSLCAVLRHILLRTAAVQTAQENKGDKMEFLYNYLTGGEFKMQLMSIVDSHKTMKDDLDREKRSMMGHWKKREKQLDVVIENAVNMYGSIKGIAGSSLPNIDSLELPEADDIGQLI